MKAADPASAAGASGYSCATLFVRLAALGTWFGLGLLLLASLIDQKLLVQHSGWVAALHPGHIWRAVVAFAALSLAFGFLTARGEVQRISAELERVRIRWGLLGGHLFAAIVFGLLSVRLVANPNQGWIFDLGALGWLISGISAVILAFLAVIPWRTLRDLLTAWRGIWIVSLIGALVSVKIEDFRPLLWGHLIGLTVRLVQMMLHPFIPGLTVDPASGMFATHRFRLIITPECAGFEGAGLILAFTLVWILIFRKECRFPRVLLLIPASVATAWLLNSVRLATLFLIGNAGAPGIALGGFHSQAGWIAFSGVALGFTVVLRQVPGLMKEEIGGSPSRVTAENPAAWYLMPFLAILAASMIGRAASDGFDWMYPLRFFAAASFLWFYRGKYKSLDWRFDRYAVFSGVIVFLMWLGLDRLTPSRSSSTLEGHLLVLAPSLRWSWIFFRVVAASTTVPIAEELAFRGFLLRRVVSPDFQSVTAARFTPVAILVSSVAFGVMHGNRWLAGTFAGLIYAWAFRRHNRLGDAALAHAVTNALLAATVLLTANWQLW